MASLGRPAAHLNRLLLTSPAAVVPIFSGGRLEMVKIQPHDWRPTAASRRRWLETYYPGSVIERERLERKINR